MDRRNYKEPMNHLIKQQKINNLTKRIRTSFIFALAETERKFGHLWNDRETKQGREYYADYQEYRKAVLDNGNNQIRLLEQDLGRIIK